MAKPVILAVDDDPQVLRAVERDLRRRYAREYKDTSGGLRGIGARPLGKLKRGDPVALFLVDQRMPKMTGVEFLEQAIDRYPRPSVPCSRPTRIPRQLFARSTR